MKVCKYAGLDSYFNGEEEIVFNTDCNENCEYYEEDEVE